MRAAAASVHRPAAGVGFAVRVMPELPVCAVRAFVRGGSRSEELPGTCCMTGRLLSEGTTARSWSRLSDELDDRGMTLVSYGTAGAHALALDALAEDWERALDLAAELLLEPAFPHDRCAWLRGQTTSELHSLADQPEVVSAWAFRRQLYTPHPLQWPLQGEARALARIDPGLCRRFHRAGLRRGVGVTVTGAIDEEAVVARLEGLFARGDARADRAPEPPAPVPRPGRLEVAVPGEGQAHVFAGRLTVSRRSPDLPALELLGVILGAADGLHGRLPRRVREQDGNAYVVAVQSAAGAGVDPGHLSIYVGTSPAAVPAVERAVVEELATLVERGVTADELDAARSYLLAVDAFRRETARQWADLLLEELFYEQPFGSRAWL